MMLDITATTGFRRFAGCRMHPAKATLHSAKPLPGAALDKEPPAKSLSAKIFLPGVFYRASGKDFAECKPGTRQRKVVVTAPAPSSLALPGAISEAPGKDFFNFFFKFSLPGAVPGRHPAKMFLFFFIISLPGVSPRGHPAKSFFIFFRNFFAGCQVMGHPAKNFFFEKTLPGALALALGKAGNRIPSFAECQDQGTRQSLKN